MISGVHRVTPQLLQVLNALVECHEKGTDIHGYDLSKQSHIQITVVYRWLKTLREANIVSATVESLEDSDVYRPRRTYIRLTAEGAVWANELLEARFPGRRRGRNEE